ncbi:11172_t:CDS:1, partial [Ambispora gerdemannii]
GGHVGGVFVRDVLSFEEGSKFLRHETFKGFDETRCSDDTMRIV